MRVGSQDKLNRTRSMSDRSMSISSARSSTKIESSLGQSLEEHGEHSWIPPK